MADLVMTFRHECGCGTPSGCPICDATQVIDRLLQSLANQRRINSAQYALLVEAGILPQDEELT